MTPARWLVRDVESPFCCTRLAFPLHDFLPALRDLSPALHDFSWSTFPTFHRPMHDLSPTIHDFSPASYEDPMRAILHTTFMAFYRHCHGFLPTHSWFSTDTIRPSRSPSMTYFEWRKRCHGPRLPGFPEHGQSRSMSFPEHGQSRSMGFPEHGRSRSMSFPEHELSRTWAVPEHGLSRTWPVQRQGPPVNMASPESRISSNHGHP